MSATDKDRQALIAEARRAAQTLAATHRQPESDLFTRLADALSHPREPEGKGGDEIAWLVERAASINDHAKWWHPNHGWVIDVHLALRFCRAQDADDYRRAMRFGYMSTVSEHVFLAPNPEQSHD